MLEAFHCSDIFHNSFCLLNAKENIQTVKIWQLEIKSQNLNTVTILQSEYIVLDLKLKGLKEKENVHTDEINRIYEAQKENENAKSYWTIEREYDDSHKEYHLLKDEIETLSNEIRDRRDERDARNEFIHVLNECINVVEE